MAKSNLQYYLEKLPKPMRNKFVVTTAVFVVWMFFFDRHSVLTQLNLNSTLGELHNKSDYYNEEIKKDTKKATELHTNDKSKEKFAREEHLMKKDDEDIFIITYKK